MDRIKAIRSILGEDCGISTDIITGFCTETEEEHNETLSLMRWVSYDFAYTFAYSERPGTPAAIKEQVTEAVKTERLMILQSELAKQQLEFNASCVGKTLPVLFQKEGKYSDHIVGKTPYMQSAYVENAEKSLLGKIVNVKITKALATSVTGELV